MDLGILEQSVQLLLAVVALMLIGSSIDTLVCLYLSHSINFWGAVFLRPSINACWSLCMLSLTFLYQGRNYVSRKISFKCNTYESMVVCWNWILLRGNHGLLKQGHNSHYCNLEPALCSLSSHIFAPRGTSGGGAGEHKPFLAAREQMTKLFTEFLWI